MPILVFSLREVGLYEYRLAEKNIFRLSTQQHEKTQVKSSKRNWALHN